MFLWPPFPNSINGVGCGGWCPHYGGLSNAVRMDQASAYLQMSARAFDLLVVRHRDIFRKAGKYDQSWYLPKWYLSHIKQHPEFPALKAKYELLARSRSARARALGMKQH